MPQSKARIRRQMEMLVQTLRPVFRKSPHRTLKVLQQCQIFYQSGNQHLPGLGVGCSSLDKVCERR
eukprot:3296757-Amphidinium_carterae.1